jgi:hypothetical protein
MNMRWIGYETQILSWPSASNLKKILTVGQNNFGNKIQISEGVIFTWWCLESRRGQFLATATSKYVLNHPQ